MVRSGHCYNIDSSIVGGSLFIWTLYNFDCYTNNAVRIFYAKLWIRKIGGITGDTLGAVVELSEIIAMFVIYILAAV